MKIAFVFDKFIHGGIERVGISYIKHLKSEGNYIDVFVLGEYDSFLDELSIFSDHVIFVKFKKYLCPYYYFKLIEKNILFVLVFPLIFIGCKIVNFLIKLFKMKKIDYDCAISFSGHFNDLTYVADDFIQTRHKVCWLHSSQIDYYTDSYAYFYLYKKIHNLVEISSYDDLFCEKIDRKFKLNITKIYNPVEVDESKKDIHKITELKNKYGKYLLYIGRLDKDKNPETIIKSIFLLKTKYKIKTNLLIVGNGEYKKELEELVNSLNLSDNVVFEGNKDDVINYYLSAYIFVHSSKREGLGMTIIEAMMFGLPVISTKCLPGINETLGNNEFGLVCDIGDEEGMSLLCSRLLNNHDTYLYYSSQSKKCSQKFSPQKIYKELDRYLSIYK